MMRLTRVFAVAARRAPVRPIGRPPLVAKVLPAAPKFTAVVKTMKTVKKTAKPRAANAYARFYASLCSSGAVHGRDGMRKAAKLWRATGKVKGLNKRIAAALKLVKHKGGPKARKGVKAAKPKKTGKKVAKKHVKKVKTTKSKAALRKAVKKVAKKKVAKKHVKKVSVTATPLFH